MCGWKQEREHDTGLGLGPVPFRLSPGVWRSHVAQIRLGNWGDRPSHAYSRMMGAQWRSLLDFQWGDWLGDVRRGKGFVSTLLDWDTRGRVFELGLALLCFTLLCLELSRPRKGKAGLQGRWLEERSVGVLGSYGFGYEGRGFVQWDGWMMDGWMDMMGL